MKLDDFAPCLSGWFGGDGPMNDIVISCRVRLARNIAGYQFLSRCSDANKAQIEQRLRSALSEAGINGESLYINVAAADEVQKELLVERQLISRYHARTSGPRGVFVCPGEFFSTMINEEDHLRMQCLRAGLQLEECWRELDRIDDLLEKTVDYAFDDDYGYLTACPTNVGTGIRVSVMLHLPALKMTGEVDKVLRAAKDLNLTVRGLHGEGTEAMGDFYQISNHVTLGVSEEQIVEEFSTIIVPKIVEYEGFAREQLATKNPAALDDKICRAKGLLSNARLISSQEAMHLLSHLRMAVNMGKIKDVSISAINQMFLLTQPAHLQYNSKRQLDPAQRDALRADMMRTQLAGL